MEIQKENAMDLPKKLASLRKEKGLSQLDLAERLHVSRQAISRWEVGTAVPNTDNLKYLSQLYGVSVDYLLHDGAERNLEDAVIQESKPAEKAPAVPVKNHSRMIICILGVVLAIAIGIAIYLAAVPRAENKKIRPIKELSSETNSQSDETFCFD